MIFRSLLRFPISPREATRKILSQQNKLPPVFNAARLSLHRGAGTAELPPFQKSSFHFSSAGFPAGWKNCFEPQEYAQTNPRLRGLALYRAPQRVQS
ncbi:hypothetical protein VTN00DRAFT_7073 [Thermoascus crustaceus]|uniref:uncharacterized protein n=1 Tax=Thermoascus crustaceus TaxID=5088 RepID=UPI0037425C1B